MVGRWLSPDPAGAGWNLYAYSTNPNSSVDPSGLRPWINNPGTGVEWGNEFRFLDLFMNSMNQTNPPGWASVAANQGLVTTSQIVTDGPVPFGTPVPGVDSNSTSVSDASLWDTSDWGAYNLPLGTWQAPGAAFNHYVCQDSGTCTLVVGAGLAVLGFASEGEGGLAFSQTTASPWFSAEGDFAGFTISDVAGALRDGTLAPSDVPVQTVTIDGNTLIVNTRSALALMQAGIEQSDWTLVDMTGDAETMNNIQVRLGNNGLTYAGTSTFCALPAWERTPALTLVLARFQGHNSKTKRLRNSYYDQGALENDHASNLYHPGTVFQGTSKASVRNFVLD